MPQNKKKVQISLPIKKLRDYQAPVWEEFGKYLHTQKKDRKSNYYLIWPRRAGKDFVALQMICDAAYTRKGSYLYMFATITDCRRVLTLNKDTNTGLTKIEELEKAGLVADFNKQDLIVHFKNGSILQLAGAEQSDRYLQSSGRSSADIIGSSLNGAVLSEAAYCPQSVLSVIDPPLIESKGFKILASTPSGQNWLYDTVNAARSSDTAWVQHLTSLQTNHMTSEQLEQAHQNMIESHGDGLGDQLYRQEYMCSWQAGALGQVFDAETIDNATTDVYYNHTHPVYVSWDLGWSDDTALTFFQMYNGQIFVFRSYNNSNETLAHYVDYINDQQFNTKPVMILPHDGQNKRLEADGLSVSDRLQRYGFSTEILANEPVQNRILSTRERFKWISIDQTNCKRLIKALHAYHYKYNKEKLIKSKPEHDWSSHLADSFCYGIHAANRIEEKEESLNTANLERIVEYYQTDYNCTPAW